MNYLDYCYSLRFSAVYNSLKYKYEYKIEHEEYKFYVTFIDMVCSVAHKLGLDHLLAQSLAYTLGLVFPPNGRSGWDAIKEYIKTNNLDIDFKNLREEVLFRQLRCVKYRVSDEFLSIAYDLIDEVYSSKEIKVVLVCYKILKDLQHIRDTNIHKYYELVELYTNKVIELSLNKDDICEVEVEEQFKRTIQTMSKEDKEAFFKEIDDCFETAKSDFKSLKKENAFITAISYLIIS